jgi:phosphohistidine phosphatase
MEDGRREMEDGRRRTGERRREGNAGVLIIITTIMKQLILIRHAKSSWDSSATNDFDRPLNERGKKDAPMMAQRLLDKKIKIHAFISSPAKRAKKTAIAFVEEFGRDKDEIIFKEELYGALVDSFYDVISEVDDKFDTIAVFSHNPGITDFANSLTSAIIDNLPTCGIFSVSVDSKHWKDIRDAEKKFIFADYPKAGQD